MGVLDVGFIDPVHESRAWFRELMDAMARPGSVRRGTPPPRAVPPPLPPIAGALLLTLADADTSLWLSAALRADGAAGTWLRFHTGASLVKHGAEATFAAATGADDAPALESLAQGEEAYPDRSTTLLLGVEAIVPGKGVPDENEVHENGVPIGDDVPLESGVPVEGGEALVLTGSGIATRTTLAVRGLPEGFVEAWEANRARFPLGVDVVLIAADAFACLPRTTRVERAGAFARWPSS